MRPPAPCRDSRGVAQRLGRRGRAWSWRGGEIGGSFGHDHAHDGFAIAGGRDTSRFDVSVTTTTNQRGIADAPGSLQQVPPVEVAAKSRLADRTRRHRQFLLVAAMIFGGVGILAAAEPGFAFGGRDEVFGIAERTPFAVAKCSAPSETSIMWGHFRGRRGG